jgi:hypothetical protein
VQNGLYVNFVDNTATFASPNGSALLGLTAEFSITDKDRSIKGTWETYLADTEFAWIWANSDEAHAGGSSGTSLGLTAGDYDRSHYVRSGFKGVTIAGVALASGVFSDPKLTLKLVGTQQDDLNRSLTCFMDVDGEFSFLQTALADLQAGLTSSQTSQTIVFNTRNDETITCTGSVSFSGSPYFGDDKTYQKATFKGRIPFNIDDESPDAIDIQAAAMTLNLIGY